jgi:hypothetical protein
MEKLTIYFQINPEFAGRYVRETPLSPKFPAKNIEMNYLCNFSIGESIEVFIDNKWHPGKITKKVRHD